MGREKILAELIGKQFAGEWSVGKKFVLIAGGPGHGDSNSILLFLTQTTIVSNFLKVLAYGEPKLTKESGVRLTEVNTLTSNSRLAVEIKLRHTLTPPILWRRVFAGFLEH